MGWREGYECSKIDLTKKEPEDVYFLLPVIYSKG
jgi:hypothetical protein